MLAHSKIMLTKNHNWDNEKKKKKKNSLEETRRVIHLGGVYLEWYSDLGDYLQ